MPRKASASPDHASVRPEMSGINIGRTNRLVRQGRAFCRATRSLCCEALMAGNKALQLSAQPLILLIEALHFIQQRQRHGNARPVNIQLVAQTSRAP